MYVTTYNVFTVICLHKGVVKLLVYRSVGMSLDKYVYVDLHGAQSRGSTMQ